MDRPSVNLGFPLFPDFTYQLGAGFERFLPGFPTGRHDLARIASMLEGFDLTDQLVRVATYFGGEHFSSPDDPIRVNNESAADVYARRLVVYSVDGPDPPATIREHGERNAALYHLGQLFLLPDLVDKAAVSTDRQDFNPQRFELVVPGSNRRQFRWSDEREIARIEA